ncbi:MAG: tetratricopeptide repeat protein [Candidatus Woesearchaeota archaeon]
MEFEQYLEHDIITFLDSKMQRKENTSVDREEEYGLYLTKDYLKELNYALDNDELTKAKKLFDELKANYSRIPKNSVERKKIYTLLEKMYEKIQNYVRIKEGRIDVSRQSDTELSDYKKDNLIEATNITINVQGENIDKKQSQKANNAVLPIQFKTAPKDNADTNTNTILPSDIGVNPQISTEELKVEIPSPDAPTISPADLSAAEDANEMLSHPTDAMSKTGQIEEDTKKKERHKRLHEEEREIPPRVLMNPPGSKKHKDLEKIKDEIIDKTAGHIEKLKTHVTDKLLSELQKKIEEKNNEHGNRIDSLRKEIIREVIKELDRRFKIERREIDHKIESLRSEILKQIYNQAGQIISSSENIHDITENNMPEDYTHEDSIIEERTSNDKVSNKNLKVNYEQAVYYMFDNKYDEAAKLFREIIISQPNNRAARIRLQECMEKQPELSDMKVDVEYKSKSDNTDIATETTGSWTDSNMQELSQTDSQREMNLEEVDDGMTEFKDSVNENIERLSYETDEVEEDSQTKDFIRKPKKKRDEEHIRELYEQAIYYIYQHKYTESAQIFKEILQINPDNRAAKIRLQECMEKLSTESGTDNQNSSNFSSETTARPNNAISTSAAENTEAEGQKNNPSGMIEFRAGIDKEMPEEDIQDGYYTIKEYHENEKSPSISDVTKIRHKRSEDELQKMYEEAVYIMYQSNYDEAVKIFKEILRIRPENKAAKIRLQECIEAINHA